MARIFLSHSSRDNVPALAFQNWLAANGWTQDDIFIDLHSISAGSNWRDALRKANARCEAVILLASPEALDSIECQKELELAEALGKEIIVAILRDLSKNDARLARYSERQFVDLSAAPKEPVDKVEFDGQSHIIGFNFQALAAIKGRLEGLGIAPDSFAWPPKTANKPQPFPGLAAFGEEDAGIFFGREGDILNALTEIRLVRRRGAPRLIVIDAASGAGKSSFLRAGLWPRLKRDTDFVPLAILRPAQGIMTGPDGLGRRLAPCFEHYGKSRAAGTIHASMTTGDVAADARAFATLLSEINQLAWDAVRVTKPEAPAPALLFAIDQGEELFSAENESESRHFLSMLALMLKELPANVDLYILVTIRADSAQTLLNCVTEFGLETPKALYLPPLMPAAYRDTVLKPAEIYSQRVQRLVVEPTLAGALVHDATGADALPLLSFTLSQLFNDYGSEGLLTLEQYRRMGGTSGSISRALTDALKQAGNAGTPDSLRHLIVPRLATWDPEADNRRGAAKRLVAKIDSIAEGGHADLHRLIDALVSARLLTRGRDTLEVAHEALLRQPPISDWLEENREFLVWRDRLIRERESYINNHRGRLIGRELEIARQWLEVREQGDIPFEDRKFILDSIAAEDSRRARNEDHERQRRRMNRRLRQLAVIVAVLFFGVSAGVAWSNRYFLDRRGVMLFEAVFPKVLSPAAEQALKPGDIFKECSDCPEMVVVPAGKFMMGSPENEVNRFDDEGPQHEVTLARSFAIGRFEVTFDEWDACVVLGGCTTVADQGWGRERRPVINVGWDAAKQYVKWLSARTGKNYRMLSEAEFEYAARAGSATAYYWGDNVGTNNTVCKGCGSQWDLNLTAPVGSFEPNRFGLFDMHGNAWTWVQDCYHDDYVGAPTDGSPWISDSGCSLHVVRGGAWYSEVEILRSANRGKSLLRRLDALGLRVARTLPP